MIDFCKAGVVKVNAADLVIVAARARVVDVGRDEVVIRARKVREVVGRAGGTGHEAFEGAEPVPCRREGRRERRRGRRKVHKQKENQKKILQSAHVVARGGRTAQKHTTGPIT